MKRIVFVVDVCVCCAVLSGCAGWQGEKVDTYKIAPNAHLAVTPVPVTPLGGCRGIRPSLTASNRAMSI